MAGDAPEEFNQAVLISAASFTGQLGNEDNYDMLRIPASMGRKVTVTVLSGADAVDIQVYTASENYSQSGKATSAAPATLIEDSGDGGDYVIRLQSGAQITYRVEISQ